MAGFMRHYTGQTYALMRIVIGFLFLWHGSQKILGFPPPPPELEQAPAAIVWISGLVELIGGLFVMVGLFTRAAAFLCSGLMGVAYWMAHGFNAPLPIQNLGELAAIYCFVFLYISSRGGGMWSFDGE